MDAFLGFNINFCQDNESKSSFGVLRGLHYQLAPHAQTKLVRVIQGSVLDVAVDIREGSPTFGQHVAVELTSENKKQLLVPRGFAHGFVVLSKEAIFAYKVDNYYAPECDRGIAFNDASIRHRLAVKSKRLQLSVKDTNNLCLKMQTTLTTQLTFMNNILVTGGNGQLGSELKEIAPNYQDYNFLFTDVKDLDITNHGAVAALIKSNNINVIINCAAYTAVDKAESEPELADAINHLAVANFAQIAKDKNIKLIHISTDYVFDGTNHKPYVETDVPNPQVCIWKNEIGWRVSNATNKPCKFYYYTHFLGVFKIWE